MSVADIDRGEVLMRIPLSTGVVYYEGDEESNRLTYEVGQGHLHPLFT